MLRPDMFVERERETVNIRGLCLSHPEPGAYSSMGVGKVTRVIDAASRHVQGVDMVLFRVSAIGSA